MTLFFPAPFSKASVFTCPHLKPTERCQNDAFSKGLLLNPFSKVSVFIGVFGRFSVHDRRKRFEKYAFSYENAFETDHYITDGGGGGGTFSAFNNKQALLPK